jgi:hypothetical protein
MKKIMFVAITLLAALLIQSCHKISGDGPTGISILQPLRV